MYCLFSLELQILITPVVSYLFCSSIVINTVRVESGGFGANRQYIYQKFEDTTGMINICNKITELRTILQRESQNS
jgi:hypothetical protein